MHIPTHATSAFALFVTTLCCAILNTSALGQVPEAPVARPPAWAEKGALVYRVFTPDAADTLEHAERGVRMAANLLDQSVPQIPIFNGLIGHDHPGPWNWDGLWPYWNRVTFRAGSWEKLAGFMTRLRDAANARASFHVNLTDVNVGLGDYPETRAFLEKLVEAQAIYRRDFNRQSKAREGDPYVPRAIDPYVDRKVPGAPANPVQIFALVDYKKFWDSGLARQMIDEFYARLPFAPPMLYLDVLNLSGGNFSTGFPDGPLGGSEQTQREGMTAIVDYLSSKGTDLATEGDRSKILGTRADGTPRAGYIWYHGRGFSDDDYRVISGGLKFDLPTHHVFGNPGAFAIAPIASTPRGIEAVKTHYEALLAGQPGTKTVPGVETWHIARRGATSPFDEYDVPGANGDVYRGDWADLVNYFYLVSIQENYHIGKRNVRQRDSSVHIVHIGRYYLTPPGGGEPIAVLPGDFSSEHGRRLARESGTSMLDIKETTVTVPAAGRYGFKLTYRVGGRGNAQVNVYVNGKLHQGLRNLARPAEKELAEVAVDAVELREGVNTIAFDCGLLRATWSDGTVAEWATPYLRMGFRAWNGDVEFARDYDRMWPDTWSGQRKIYFFSWDGTDRPWTLPADWRGAKTLLLRPLTPGGRGEGERLTVTDGRVSPKLRPQVPYVLVE